MSYVDGYILPVKSDGKSAYGDLARRIGEIYLDHGALAVWECWGDDVPQGQHSSFPRAVALKPDESVVFAWCVWPSRDARDAGLASAAKDPRFADLVAPDLVDGQRMVWGGFEPIVTLAADQTTGDRT